jgi:hypothetical protein
MIGGPGIALQIGGRVMMMVGSEKPANPRAKADDSLVLPGVAVAVVGTVLLIIGLSMYAKAKGHNPAWGLMGLLSIIGLIVLAALPDRLKSAR